ncbi:Glycine-rich RNA-binding protein blt801 [Camellia lanceoleosa]|uniref:Glycine-rich RNA-binding protein blt801 n=1 Tax=Camellia lanceoleosa TaxID=1840588 RepID=A0ACC0HW27_9ERIC|nr:Glycine-rich RNA-binding protein blt801 [Camellia lanceoleosa]
MQCDLEREDQKPSLFKDVAAGYVDDVDYGAFSQFGEVIESKVRLIHTLQRSDLFRGSVPNGQDLDGRNITFNEAQSRGSNGGGGGGFRGGGRRREGGYGGGGCR